MKFYFLKPDIRFRSTVLVDYYEERRSTVCHFNTGIEVYEADGDFPFSITLQLFGFGVVIVVGKGAWE